MTLEFWMLVTIVALMFSLLFTHLRIRNLERRVGE